VEGVAQEREGVDGLVLARFQDRRDYRLGFGAGGRAVAAPDFAIDDGRLEGLLGAMVGGRDVGSSRNMNHEVA